MKARDYEKKKIRKKPKVSITLWGGRKGRRLAAEHDLNRKRGKQLEKTIKEDKRQKGCRSLKTDTPT